MRKDVVALEGTQLTKEINREFLRFFMRAVKVARGHVFPMSRHFFWQARAARRRSKKELAGLHVPAFAIYSITRSCNLLCKGCYYQHLHHRSEADLPLSKVDQIINEAEELGISIMFIAGGEPFSKEGLVGILKKHPRMVFPVFTNGTLITAELAQEISMAHNIFPIISLEGDLAQTDDRRGDDVYTRVLSGFKHMQMRRQLYGVSITITQGNFDLVMSSGFVQGIADKGCRIVFFVEYVPCDDRTDQVLSSEQRQELRRRLTELYQEFNMLFVAFPGDEDVFGGCLAAGRGFVHINHAGRVEPCPFSPFSDVSLQDATLTEALQSGFFESIRREQQNLVEHSSGCALWENRQWVEETLNRLKSKN